jgi:hypothetical protein
MFKLLSQGQPGLFICNPVVKELLLEVVELRPKQILGSFPGGDLMISRDAQGPGGLDYAEQGSEIW